MPLLSFSQKNHAWKSGNFSAPWDTPSLSIFEHITALQAQDEDPNKSDLPDEERLNADNSIRFVYGALNSLLVGDSDGDPKDVVNSIRQVLKNPSSANIKKFYHLLQNDGAIGVVDGAISLISQNSPDSDRFRMFFEWLARSSPDRGPVKFAIAMLGILQGDTFKDMFLAFGTHEEFTKFAAVALTNSLPTDEAHQAQVRLAHTVEGWGRVDLVERLAPDGDAKFRHWLVREGFKNTIMYEYLACIAARDGRLLEQLTADNAKSDDALLDGAADIFIALVAGGPAEDMSDYPDGVTAAFRWFDLVKNQPGTLLRASAAKTLRTYCKGQQGEHTWSSEIVEKINEYTTRYLEKDEISVLTLQHLKAGSGSEYWLAKELAPALGIDPWPTVFDLQISNTGQDYWYDLMRTDDPERIDRVVALALEQLPLDSIATGPAKELGLGPEWRHHSALDFIVQDLGRFPGKGWPLVVASLHSPVTRNRNMAAKALDGWPKASWPADALQLIRQAIRDEPDTDLKARLEKLLGPSQDHN